METVVYRVLLIEIVDSYFGTEINWMRVSPYDSMIPKIMLICNYRAYLCSKKVAIMCGGWAAADELI